jgi:hypothetical protein
MASKICPVEHRARSELRVDEVDFAEELGQAEVDIAGERRRRCMSKANPSWGAPRIHGELLKLGIEVSLPGF